ncbi:MAG: hypothetical protein IJZ89_01815 [Clostridia bacterium]|nr:hypothetical protein [Clostridia bacterium]
MKDRRFFIILISVIVLCLALTSAHIIYAVNAYQHSSIIYFIGKELW